jgi:predicted DNA-binding transcriptional regulator YafY
LPPVVFTEPEALSLVMAVLNDLPAAGELLGSALTKVIRALPESIGRQATTMREHATPTPDRHAARPDPALAGALVAAAAARRRVEVAYRSESGREWSAEVDPWAVVIRYGRWYLLCFSHRADAIRTYRIDRIQAVEQTGHPFEPPAGLDPVTTVAENLGAGWEYPTRVVFEHPMAEVTPWIRPTMGRLEPDGAGCALVGSTSNPTMYAQEWLSTVPLPFRVVDGPELRAAVRELAARFTAAAD